MCVCTLFSILSFILSPFSSIFHIHNTHSLSSSPAFRQYLYYTHTLSLPLSRSHSQIQCDKITFKISCYRRNTLNETICSLKRNIMHSILPSSAHSLTIRVLCAVYFMLTLAYLLLRWRCSFTFNWMYISFIVLALFSNHFVRSFVHRLICNKHLCSVRFIHFTHSQDFFAFIHRALCIWFMLSRGRSLFPYFLLFWTPCLPPGLFFPSDIVNGRKCAKNESCWNYNEWMRTSGRCVEFPRR